MRKTLRPIHLREWLPQEISLSTSELTELRECGLPLVIQPLGEGRYSVQPGSIVGSLATSSLRILVEPKFEIDRVLYLISQARDLPLLRLPGHLGPRAGLTEGFIALFVAMLRKRLGQGLLMGYKTQEEALVGLRGRLRSSDQMRRRFGVPVPLEVRYDDFTADMPENQLLKAALRRLAGVSIASPVLRRQIPQLLAPFAAVSDVRFDRRTLPNISYTRLTEPYRSLHELAGLILTGGAAELAPGRQTVSGLLFDMNRVFEDFVFASLGRRVRQLLGPAYVWAHGHVVSLDEGGTLRPQPDLSLWHGPECVFVGDVKYKRTREGQLSDLYQLLAYCSATGLPLGLLIYAERVAEISVHQIVRGGPQLVVETLNVEASVPELERRCDDVANTIARTVAAGPIQTPR